MAKLKDDFKVEKRIIKAHLEACRRVANNHLDEYHKYVDEAFEEIKKNDASRGNDDGR